MNDRSLPLMDTAESAPADADPPASAEAGRVQLTWQTLTPVRASARFVWPTPPLAAYPLPQALQEAEPCEVEGRNGNLITGTLQTFDPVQGLLRLQVPPERAPMRLRLHQIRRLTLLRPLAPLTAARMAQPDGDDAARLLAHHPSQPYQVQLVGGGESCSGRTIAPVDTEAGLFFFEPYDGLGSVRRTFVPRVMIGRLDLGDRLGVLLTQDSARPEQVEQGLALQRQLRQQKLGERLLSRQVLTHEQLLAALDRQARMPQSRLGEALVSLGFLTEGQLQEALQEQDDDRAQPLGEVLVRVGLVTPDQVRAAMARKQGFPVVDLSTFAIEPAALRALPLSEARRLHVLPLMLGGERLVMALADPSRIDVVRAAEAASQRPVAPALAGRGDLSEAIERAYAALDATPPTAPADASHLEGTTADDTPTVTDPSPAEAPDDAAAPHGSPQAAPAEPRADAPPLLQTLVRLLQDALACGATAVHLEATQADATLQIRLRRDGRLQALEAVPANLRGPLMARLKALAGLDIDEVRRPQEGRIAFGRLSAAHPVELRVHTLPTHGGLEDAVVVLPTRLKPLALDKLGLVDSDLQRYKTLLQRPAGLLLCVGPARSGQTTTLHAALARLNRPERRAWAIEERLELSPPGLRQMEVNRRAGLSSEQALRSLLQTDADVIMVASIADPVTARLAVDAALQGRLVLAGLAARHAGDAVQRLLDHGLPSWDLADALIGVHAQRMLRRLCSTCRMARSAKDAEVDEWLDGYLHGAVLADAGAERNALRERWTTQYGREGRLRRYQSPGCDRCGGLGLRSRLAVHELMTVSRDLRRLIRAGAPSWHLQRQAMRDGMRTLRQDAVEKMVAGLTTLDEVRTLIEG